VSLVFGLERALSISQTQRWEKPRKWPMAYVEEEILEEPIQVPLESLLFIVSNDWQPPSHNPATTRAPSTMEGATCIIEEEFLHLDSVASIQNMDSQVGTKAEVFKAVEATNTLGVEVEDHLVLAPPPLTTLPDFCHAPPPLFHSEQLKLIFKLRNQMADQIHRDTLMH
jgi:hypothetical protein